MTCLKFVSFLIVFGIASTLSATAAIVLSDDFSSGAVDTAAAGATDGFRIRERNIDDNIWGAARQGGGSEWMINGGQLENSSTVNTPGYPNYIPGEGPVAQALSTAAVAGLLPTDTGLELTFDYNVATGDTLIVNLWGYTGTFDPASGNIVSNLESRFGLGNAEGSTTLDAFNLLDGATTGFGGSSNPLTSLTGSGTFSTVIDVASLGIAGVTTVEDLSVISLGFGKIEDGLAGTTSLDNLTLIAIPEPSTITFLSLLFVASAFFRHRRAI